MLMSYTCNLFALEQSKKWLEEELGVTIFKVQKLPDDEWPFSNRQILFYVMDPEFETMIALKYPPGTFRKHNI